MLFIETYKNIKIRNQFSLGDMHKKLWAIKIRLSAEVNSRVVRVHAVKAHAEVDV
jgi:hypothetical protein